MSTNEDQREDEDQTDEEGVYSESTPDDEDQTDRNLSVDDSEDVTTDDPPADEGQSVSNATVDDDEQDTFPKSYVQKLRDENAKFRQRAQKSDELAHRLHTALVEATGRLADPADLPFNDEHLDDPQKLANAVDELLLAKPHLASRKPRGGDIGMGAGAPQGTVDLAAILRAGAR